MPGVLEVDLNRGGPHSIDVGSSSFAAEGAFDVVLDNHGASLHVHLHLDDDLSRAASLANANHYVDEGAVRRVRVNVDERFLPVTGRLEIVTGYGAETEYLSVTIREPGDEEPRVVVDERLGRPRSRSRSDPEAGLADPDRLPVIALGAVALLIAVVAAVVVRDLLVLAGVLVVLIGVAVAGLLLRE